MSVTMHMCYCDPVTMHMCYCDRYYAHVLLCPLLCTWIIMSVTMNMYYVCYNAHVLL